MASYARTPEVPGGQSPKAKKLADFIATGFKFSNKGRRNLQNRDLPAEGSFLVNQISTATMVPLISLEDHFTGAVVLDRPSANKIPNFMFPQSVVDNLADIGANRISDMDKGNMSIMVISHIPAVEPPEICRKVNDQLFKAVQESKGRYRGFGFVPMGEPSEIPAELERCVKQLGFVGALIPNHADGRYYDDEDYWPMFEKAQELDVPIYIHPTPAADFKRFEGNYDKTIQTLLAGPAFAWHADIAENVIRMYGSGLFDRYPRVKIVIGHMGETIPFMLERIDRFMTRRWKGSRDRSFLTVWNEQFWVTTSGFWSLDPFACLIRTCKPDRVMYSKYCNSRRHGFSLLIMLTNRS